MLLFVGGKVRRGRQRRADYIFRYRPDHPFAVVEVEAHYKQASDTQAGTGLSGPGRARMRNLCPIPFRADCGYGFRQVRDCYMPMLRPRDLFWVWRSSSSAVSRILEWRSI